MSTRALNQEQFFHGTVARLRTGSVVRPAKSLGKAPVHKISDPEYAYATTDPEAAWSYASLAHDWHVNDHSPPFPVPSVYRVEPVGDYEKDDNMNTYDGDRRSRQGWRVVGREPLPESMGEPEDWRR